MSKQKQPNLHRISLRLRRVIRKIACDERIPTECFKEADLNALCDAETIIHDMFMEEERHRSIRAHYDAVNTLLDGEPGILRGVSRARKRRKENENADTRETASD